jgi:diaminopimelate epimerase
MSKGLPLTKLSATGNDFLLVDFINEAGRELWSKIWASVPKKTLVERLCDRHEGLGADGLVVLNSDPNTDFQWEFFNSDGGEAEMCGNAARAVSLYYASHYNKNYLEFRTRVGTVKAWVKSPSQITVALPKIAEVQWDQVVAGIKLDFIRPGVPHAVVRLPSLANSSELRQTALNLKADPRFRQEGVNVTYVELQGPGEIRSVTYERGVENFTLACGTGAIAAAFSVLPKEDTSQKKSSSVSVRVPGGDLHVQWVDEHPHLTGPAKIIANIEWLEPTENIK